MAKENLTIVGEEKKPEDARAILDAKREEKVVMA
jgi:hypothetical protein